MSRRKRNAIVTLALVFAAVLVFLDHSPLKRSWRPQTNDLEKYHAKSFTVANVVDGDTLDVDIPDGTYQHTRIRLWGVDTPETKSNKYGVMYFGPEATNFTTEMTMGKKVTLYLDQNSRTRGKYGRLLAYVKLPDGTFLNESLLTEGFAYADLRFRHGLYNKYKGLQAVARQQKRGLWLQVTRDQLPQWLQREQPNLLKKK